METDWFNPKRYPHIGRPISFKGRGSITNYIEKLSNHAFFPLIKRIVSKRQSKVIDGKRIRRVKNRTICYATHLDSLIYSYYASKMQGKYETFLSDNGISECVTAYRSIPTEDNTGNKCNIHYAKEVFDSITVGSTAIVCDIKGFFDNLDHKLIKQSWKRICGELDSATYNIYKSIIKHSYVNENELFNLFKDEIICQTTTKTTKRKVKHIKYMRDKKAIAFCERADISKIRKIIRKGNDGDKGIPQGLAISSVVSNIYMADFDIALQGEAIKHNALYRRYCDDIIIVCKSEDASEFKEILQANIQKVKLEIQEEKTNVVEFNGEKKKLEYLGFSFDGSQILIKSSGLGSYYNSMYKAINRSRYYSIRTSNQENKGEMFINKLLYRFSKVGARRHKIYLRNKKTKKFVYAERRSHGNFLTYVNKSADIMESEAITKQLRHNKYKLTQRIEAAKKVIKARITSL